MKLKTVAVAAASWRCPPRARRASQPLRRLAAASGQKQPARDAASRCAASAPRQAAFAARAVQQAAVPASAAGCADSAAARPRPARRASR